MVTKWHYAHNIMDKTVFEFKLNLGQNGICVKTRVSTRLNLDHKNIYDKIEFGQNTISDKMASRFKHNI